MTMDNNQDSYPVYNTPFSKHLDISCWQETLNCRQRTYP
jgi:hypothetical protein